LLTLTEGFERRDRARERERLLAAEERADLGRATAGDGRDLPGGDSGRDLPAGDEEPG
jgi:hypothetical protein